MIFHLFRPAPQDRIIASLYGTIVAQARTPAFYQLYGVPDTVNGRFEMVVLHVVMLLQRLEAEPEPVRALGQGVFDVFCRDMDANLREMGVGDLAVPRNMRRIGEAFYGRQTAYRAALLGRADDDALATALGRNIFGSQSGPGPARLGAYTREAIHALAGQQGAALGRAELCFPDPVSIEVPVAQPQAVVKDDASDK